MFSTGFYYGLTWMTLKRATEVASFMTPSPNTSEYSTPASSGRITCQTTTSIQKATFTPVRPQGTNCLEKRI